MYESNGKFILKIVGCIVAILLLTSISRSCSRADQNMIPIVDNYCYDKNTHIIYIESYTGRYSDHTTYTPYYDKDGDLVKYDVRTREWKPIVSTKEGAE